MKRRAAKSDQRGCLRAVERVEKGDIGPVLEVFGPGSSEEAIRLSLSKENCDKQSI
jgi:hypothetical protein